MSKRRYNKIIKVYKIVNIYNKNNVEEPIKEVESEEEEEIKSGWKTTEFWITLLTVICGAIISSGLLPHESNILKILGIIVSILSSTVYTTARTCIKTKE